MGIHRYGIGPFLLVGLYRGFAIWNNFHPFHRSGPLRRLQTHQSQIPRRIGILLIVLFAFSFEIYGVIIWGYTVCCRNADALSISDSAAGRTRRRNGRWLFHNKSMARQQKNKKERKKEIINEDSFLLLPSAAAAVRVPSRIAETALYCTICGSMPPTLHNTCAVRRE